MFFYIKPVWADPVWQYMIETVLLAAMTASAESVFHLAGLCICASSSCQNEVLQTRTVVVTAIEATLSICQFMCLSVWDQNEGPGSKMGVVRPMITECSCNNIMKG